MKKIINHISKDTGLPIEKIDIVQLLIYISHVLDVPCSLSSDLVLECYEYEFDEGTYICELNIDINNQSEKTIKILSEIILPKN